jgi:hypothetical protein
MLGFGASVAAKNKEIHILMFRGTYNIADFRIKKIFFHYDL